MTPDDRGVVRDFLEQAVNKHDLAKFDRYLSGSKDVEGSMNDRMRQYFGALNEASSDFTYHIEDMIDEDGKVVVRSTIMGTNDGDGLDRKASGNSFSVRAIDIFQVKDGKIGQHWGVIDNLDLIHQIAEPRPKEAAPQRAT